jgi:hypothetical protein
MPAVAGPPHTGGCLCGTVRFEIDALGPASYCHCTRCQRRTGGGTSAQTRIDGSQLRIVSGEDRLGSFRPDQGFEKLFCAGCGSQLFSRNIGDATQMSIRLGAFDEDPGVRPQWRQFVAYAAHWEQIPDDGLPRYEESKPGGFAEDPD